MKKFALASTILSAGICACSAAHAVNVDISIGAPAPVYVAPAHVYVAPAPVYVPPPPVRVAPAPFYAPAPVPAYVVIGWHGDRYYDGRRYWARRDWEERQRHRHDRDWDDRDHGHGHGKGHGHHDH